MVFFVSKLAVTCFLARELPLHTHTGLFVLVASLNVAKNISCRRGVTVAHKAPPPLHRGEEDCVARGVDFECIVPPLGLIDVRP